VSLVSVATLLQAFTSAKKMAEKFANILDAGKSDEEGQFTGI
jgi:hypothetical protein